MLDWDRSHDWVLERFWHDRTRVAIRFRQVPPSVTEMVAVRRCLPQYRHIPPAAFREMITGAGLLPLGVLPAAEANELIRGINAQDLEVVTQDASHAGYLPVDQTNGTAMLIHDAEEAAALVGEMLAAGVPVNNREA